MNNKKKDFSTLKLDTLPINIWQVMGRYLDKEDFYNVSRCNKKLYHIIKEKPLNYEGNFLYHLAPMPQRAYDVGPRLKDCLRLFHHKDAIKALVSINEDCFASASNNKTIALWNSRTNAFIRTLEGHENSIQALAVWPFGEQTLLISGDTIGYMKIWTLEGECVHTLLAHESGINALVTVRNIGIISAGNDFLIHVFDPHSWQKQYSFRHHNCVTSLTVLDDKHIASNSADNTIKVWDLMERKMAADIEKKSGWLNSLATVSPDVLLHASNNNMLYLINWKKQTYQVIDPCTSFVKGVLVLPNGEIAYASDDDYIRIFHPETFKCINHIIFTCFPTAMTMLHNGNIILGMPEGTLILIKFPLKKYLKKPIIESKNDNTEPMEIVYEERPPSSFCSIF